MDNKPYVDGSIYETYGNLLTGEIYYTREITMDELDIPKLNNYPKHPSALPDNRSGAYGMKAPCIAFHLYEAKYCRVDEFLCDGDAYVVWTDGSLGTVKWNVLISEEKAKQRQL